MLALVIGVLVGLVLGLTGAGGSVLAVPLLVYLLDLPVADAAGLSLGMVALAALAATLARLFSASGRSSVAWMPALVLVGSGAVLVPAGQWLGQRLPQQPLLLAFAVLTLMVALRMWRLASRDPDSSRYVRAGVASGAAAPACELSESGQFEMRLPCVVRMLLAGALVGLLSGLFGVGGGFVIVPALVLLTGLPMAQAVATSLLVIALVASAGFASFLFRQSELPLLAWWLAGGALLGMGAGMPLARYLAGPLLQKLFAVLLLLVAAAVTLMEVMA